MLKWDIHGSTTSQGTVVPACGHPAAMYRTSSMLFIASLCCHVCVPACASYAQARAGLAGQVSSAEKKPRSLRG